MRNSIIGLVVFMCAMWKAYSDSPEFHALFAKYTDAAEKTQSVPVPPVKRPTSPSDVQKMVLNAADDLNKQLENADVGVPAGSKIALQNARALLPGVNPPVNADELDENGKSLTREEVLLRKAKKKFAAGPGVGDLLDEEKVAKNGPDFNGRPVSQSDQLTTTTVQTTIPGDSSAGPLSPPPPPDISMSGEKYPYLYLHFGDAVVKIRLRADLSETAALRLKDQMRMACVGSKHVNSCVSYLSTDSAFAQNILKLKRKPNEELAHWGGDGYVFACPGKKDICLNGKAKTYALTPSLTDQSTQVGWVVAAYTSRPTPQQYRQSHQSSARIEKIRYLDARITFPQRIARAEVLSRLPASFKASRESTEKH